MMRKTALALSALALSARFAEADVLWNDVVHAGRHEGHEVV